MSENDFPFSAVTALLAKALRKNGYDYPEAIQQQWIKYLHLLHRWNRVTNLTAVRDPQEMVLQHILDSLSILPYLRGERFIDIGSGAGLPGIPLAIIQPEKEFYLLDSNNKKTRFLNQVMLELGLKNVTVIHARCEQWHPEKCFNGVITRAFSSLKNMVTTTQHLLCPGGEFLAMKGVYPEEEINELPEEFKLIAVHELKIKGLDQQRCLVKISKS